MSERLVKRADVSELALLQACEWFHTGVYELTPDETLAGSYPAKVILARMQQLADRGLLEIGVSLRTAWLSDAGRDRLAALATSPNHA